MTDLPRGDWWWECLLKPPLTPLRARSLPKDTPMTTTAEALAQRFHELYEQLAPAHGYETRPESAKPWTDVPAQNRGLMIEVCGRILGELHTGAFDPMAPASTEHDVEVIRNRGGACEIVERRCSCGAVWTADVDTCPALALVRLRNHLHHAERPTDA